jgi:flagellar P-ring protein precursor FlgI
MKRTLRPALVALAVLACAVSTATATSRIKDLASIEGIRQNQLIGLASSSASMAPATR